MEAKRVLVIEDSDRKFEAVHYCIQEAESHCIIERASTMIEAEQKILERFWSLVVLDVSMDITPSRYGPRVRGQANIGGLGIARKMFLLEKEAPTIIVTAFDSFTATGTVAGGNQILGFEEIAGKAQEFLSSYLIACLRYNGDGWKQEMIAAVRKAFDNADLGGARSG